MKKTILFILLIISIPVLNSYKAPRNGNTPYVQGEVIIKLYSNLPQNQQQMLHGVLEDHQDVELSMVQRLSDRLNIFLLSYNPDLIDDERMLEKIKAHPFVELAQFNHYVEQRELIPDDVYFDDQWNMHNTGQNGGVPGADIHGPEGWDLGTSGVAATGDTIIISVVDDGFDLDHEDLIFWKNYHEIPNNGIDDDTNGYVDDYHGWNSWSNNGIIVDKDHGTHVTGIAAAKGNNVFGVSGVNWNVKVLPVVGSATASFEYVVIAAYSYVYEMRSLYNETGGNKGAFIVSTNSSFGSSGQPEDHPVWGAMYDSMGMAGILSAAATVNAHLNIDEVGDIPTSFASDFLITVTNTTNMDAKNSNAGYGLVTIDIGAPGTSVFSTRMTNQYGYKTGTSMASPHVAGAVAYLFSVATQDFVEAYKDDPAGMALVIKQYILNGVDPLPTLEGITVSGGRLNIYNSAMQMLNPDISFDPMSILQLMDHDKLDTVALFFTNNTDGNMTYDITWPDTLDWISLSGATEGTLSPKGSDSVMVQFDTYGMTADTLFTFLTFNYGEGRLFNIPVHLIVDPYVGVEAWEQGSGEAGKPGSLLIWPNPGSEVLKVKCSGFSVGKNVSLSILNISGVIVDVMEIPEGQDEARIRAENYAPGVYFVILKEGENLLGEGKFVVGR